SHKDRRRLRSKRLGKIIFSLVRYCGKSPDFYSSSHENRADSHYKTVECSDRRSVATGVHSLSPCSLSSCECHSICSQLYLHRSRRLRGDHTAPVKPARKQGIQCDQGDRLYLSEFQHSP